ncbi:ADP-ribosylglycohydrolase family protein [Kocuria tytonis]|uniref:ADP-ribosylglycohydrolase family protein n=1 Tax=Kocuria tytonis TaxID=2054280 RepID=A0A495A9B7_9MICC|nr:ADP-ribosylglycohydrolase family protein [Kocuria tytonis]RKQ36636.1 ADP-ribosylglycohydrolase family protein [Kocuria tytonis]
MTSVPEPELLDRDRGLDASAADYPIFVRSVVLAPWSVQPRAGAGEATQLAARTVNALNEVARWANDGQAADPTACAWLSYLRWAVANGAHLFDDAPHPPADDFDRDFPLLARPGEHAGDSFTALATGRLGEVARPVLPLGGSPEVLARTAPYGLLPNIGWKSLVALAVDSAAITHGSAEAQTAAAGMALAVHAAFRARDTGAALGHVVAETRRVCALMTRPAPVTRDLLARCCDARSRDALLDTSTTPEGQHAASHALALGFAAVLHAADEHPGHPAGSGDGIASRALVALPRESATLEAARTVALTVAAARWGLDAASDAPATDPVAASEKTRADTTATGERDVRAELLILAREWNARWRP